MRQADEKSERVPVVTAELVMFRPREYVTLRRGSGRVGLIVSPSEQPDYEWLVAWENSNILTLENGSDLVPAGSASHQAVRRRGPARELSAASSRSIAETPIKSGLRRAIAAVRRRRA